MKSIFYYEFEEKERGKKGGKLIPDIPIYHEGPWWAILGRNGSTWIGGLFWDLSRWLEDRFTRRIKTELDLSGIVKGLPKDLSENHDKY